MIRKWPWFAVRTKPQARRTLRVLFTKPCKINKLRTKKGSIPTAINVIFIGFRGPKRPYRTRSDILLVGEAENLNEAVAKAKQMRPDVVVFDVHLSEGCEQVRWSSIFGGIGGESFIDKMNLTEELIPAILGLSKPQPYTQTTVSPRFGISSGQKRRKAR
jgi:CheY-like chemotaxis protein